MKHINKNINNIILKQNKNPLTDLKKIIKKIYNYENINKCRKTLMRQRKNGLDLNDLLLYRLNYCKINETQSDIVSDINDINDKKIVDTAFYKKESNVPIKIYEQLLSSIKSYYNNFYSTSNSSLIEDNDLNIYAVDGVYNNDIKKNDQLNMGFFDINENVPIDIVPYGKQNKNKEIYCSTDYIKKNISLFKKTILIFDRGYYSYDFMKYLIDNNVYFIIRAKGNADKLDPEYQLPKSDKNYNAIMSIRDHLKSIKYDQILEKEICLGDSKKKKPEHIIKIKNNYTLITNLLDDKYDDDIISKLYSHRWDIEVFFKYLKDVFKFQHTKQSNKNTNKKKVLCNMIIIYITKILVNFYLNKNPITQEDGYIKKINNKKATNGVFKKILPALIKGSISNNFLNKFCNSYMKIVKNKTERSFPRISNTPFTKWYTKKYSIYSDYIKIIDAIKNNTLDKLNKNLKTKAKSIISINGTNYNPS